MSLYRQAIYLTYILGVVLIGFNTVHCNEKISVKAEATGVDDLEVPDPMNLRMQWWDSFIQEVSSDSQQAHIEEVSHQLNRAAEPLQGKDKDIAQSLISRIVADLKSLAQLHKEEIGAAFPRASPSAAYNFEQLFEIADMIRKLESNIKHETKELQRLITSISVAKQQIDNLWVDYLRQKEPNLDKFLLGLEIMANRAALAVIEESQRLAKERISNYEKDLEWQQQELKTAQKLLSIENIKDEDLESNAKKARQEYEKAQRILNKEEASAVSFAGTDLYSQSSNALKAQRFIEMSCEERVKELNYILAEVKIQFKAFQENRDALDEDSIKAKIQDWEEQLVVIQDKYREWMKAAQTEQERLVSTYLEHLDKETEKDEKLVSLSKDRFQQLQNTFSSLQSLENRLLNVNLAIQELTDRIDAYYFTWFNWWSNTLNLFFQGKGVVETGLFYSLFKIGDTPITLYALFKIAAIIALAYFVSNIFSRTLTQVGRRKGVLAEPVLYTVTRLAHYTILLIGIVFALISVGLDFTNLALIAGAVGVGIGFGLQSIVRDLINGLLLLFGQVLKVGDIIELSNGHVGRVKEIHLQSTVIHTFDGIDVIMPNTELVANSVINWTMSDSIRRMHIPFSLAYGVDKEQIKKIITEAACKVPYTLKGYRPDKDPDLWLVGYGEWCLNFELIVWINLLVKDKQPPKAAYYWEIDTALKQHDIQMFVPTSIVLANAPDGFNNPQMT